MTRMSNRDRGIAALAIWSGELSSHELWIRVWWVWDAETHDWFSIGYHWFNLLEAVIWFGIAVRIAVRNLRGHRTALEWSYALAFLIFGLTDIVEARQQSSPLILFKLWNLIALVWLRRKVAQRPKAACH